MKVLITGGSGLIGSALTKRLLLEGVEVTHLTRTKNSKLGVKTYVWDWKKSYLEENALDGVTHIIHLAGAGIADKPWTMARKRVIIKSRVLTARLLEKEIRKSNHKLEAFISASGIGYYGATTSDEIYTEEGKRGDDFVAECCVQWEDAANELNDLTRVVTLRTGIVLDKDGGAVAKIGSSIRRGIGAALSSGEQYMPWIHLDDMVDVYYQSLMNSNIVGCYNAVSDEHINNKTFTKELADAMNRKLWLPNVPAFMMKMIFGEMSEILLKGSRVSNAKMKSAGIKFKYSKLKPALTSLYEKKS
ncbi:MAG: hypothetical protein ACI9N1_001119 [Flavobacteriales bacterium]|jgi:uncharacterized protein (TIGR01777 family)